MARLYTDAINDEGRRAVKYVAVIVDSEARTD